MTSETDRRELLRVAREAIAAHVGHRPAASAANVAIASTGGAFVTLHVRGELRGCIGHVGHIGSSEAVLQVIARCAVSASSEDPRFPPIDAAELPELAIELSLLGPLEPIAGPTDIEIGRHGLVVESGFRRGLLLPQVATEWNWDAETFLAHTCRKAGLSTDAWKRGASLWRFEAEVFAE